LDTSVELTPQVASVRTARRLVTSRLATAAPSPDMVGEVAELLTSELATNAVVHARTRFTVSVGVQRDSLRVAVRDGSFDLPRVREPKPDDLAGRGMALVAALAPRWGVHPVNGGKEVWFELDF
jgi:anti-sigma regulatory factor (Ser/Thr protein kinase)